MLEERILESGVWQEYRVLKTRDCQCNDRPQEVYREYQTGPPLLTNITPAQSVGSPGDKLI
jgi:hypothetical protein